MGKGDGMGMGGGMGMGMGGQYSVTGAPYALSGQTSNHSNPQARAPRGNKSMLSDIGSQIASRINAPVPSGASNGAYESAYSKNRVMVGENHRAYPTGYTGGRKGL
ncbi:hypothetical protein B484DRAFT_402261 [Ochromonadaceae sp. CCMP2298]|nr:hypothetical protein B484DRAFT_402261 [Ochromonadaceae sp. CCMP2298]